MKRPLSLILAEFEALYKLNIKAKAELKTT